MDNDSSIASPQDDGAGEKLVDEKNGHNSKGIEVKYVTPTSQNGDAKIDIENLKSAFAGMGKEELMKFANDPFWVRTRWFLFILFWLLWIAMLVGAIAIIVLAPKCAPPTPKEWWEQSPLYKADVATFTKDTGSSKLNGFTTKLDYLKDLGVQTVVLSNILKVSDKNSDGEGDEFKTIASSYGTLDDFKALISAATEKGLKILMTLVPNHSSLKNEFFRKSAENDTKYSSYYVWSSVKNYDDDSKPLPPNNWLQVGKDSVPAWKWHEGRKAFYLHQFDEDEPDFNFHNPDVVNYFIDVMKYWLNLGVSGFYLERTPYLLEAINLTNETQELRKLSENNYLNNYGFYSHVQTSNLPELVPLLQGWKSFVANSSGILMVDSITLDRSVAKGTKVVDLVIEPKPQTLPPYPTLSAENLKNLISSTLVTNSWPVWQIKVEKESEGSDLSKGLLLCSMLLPGVPVTVAGQELGLKNLAVIPWDNTTGSEGTDVSSQQKNKHSMYSAYHKLVEARKSASILHGEHSLHVFNSSDVFAYTRIKSGNPGYLVVFNLEDDETVVDVRQVQRVPDELTLLLTSDDSQMANLTKVESSSVSLPSRAVAVFTLVPK